MTSPLLELDNPLERRLALKGKKSPAELRVALQDEDPEVRLLAVNHPDLTSELIESVLKGDDDWLVEECLKRPDLRHTELEHALSHPVHRVRASRHPALSDEQRQRFIEHPDTPEGLRQDLLAKNVGLLTYPAFGEGTSHTTAMVVPNRKYNKYRKMVTGKNRVPPKGEEGMATANRMRGGSSLFGGGVQPTKPELRHIGGVVRDITPAKLIVQPKHITELTGEAHRVLPGRKNQALFTDEAHENQHLIFRRLDQRYGGEVGTNIINATLNRIDKQHLETVSRLYRATGRDAGACNDEESIAYMQNYLMDPEQRRKFHIKLGIHNNPEAQRELHTKAKEAWLALRRAAQALRPEDIGVQYREPGQDIREWLGRLKKANEENTLAVQDHLGFDYRIRDLVAAVEFLTGQPFDAALFRKVRARFHNEDIESAVLEAAGLTPADKPALDAILGIRKLHKAETEGPQDVQAVLPQDEDVAEGLRWAVENDEVKPVKLGGKHSSGTKMARDEDSHLWLLKPGDNRDSPAKGAAEQPASQSRREAVFWCVAQAWGIGAVPRTALVLMDGREVAAIEMLGLDWLGLHRAAGDHPGLEQQALRPYLESSELHRWAVLDHVLGNADRHGQNLLVGPAPEYAIALIDHGSALAGASFDPGHDDNSFVPYYLRIWVKDWAKLSPEDRAERMPILPTERDLELRRWVESLDEEELNRMLARYGAAPAACVGRLRNLKEWVVGNESASRAVDEVWA